MVQMTGPRHAFKIVALGPKIGKKKKEEEKKGNKQSEGKVIIPTHLHQALVVVYLKNVFCTTAE